MKYDIDFINLKYELIASFLIKAEEEILDISYSVYKKELTIQVVVLQGHSLSNEKKEALKHSLNNFNITINEVYLTREQYNETKGEWSPKYYKWLDNLLYSKAETK